MALIQAAHLLSIGIWLGCIATETLFEHAMGRDPTIVRAVARLHVKVDLWVELPAFLAVLATGCLLATVSTPTPWLLAKMSLGLSAILVNAACVWVVAARHSAFARHDDDHAAVLDRLQHKLGGVLLFAIFATLLCAGLAH